MYRLTEERFSCTQKLVELGVNYGIDKNSVINSIFSQLRQLYFLIHFYFLHKPIHSSSLVRVVIKLNQTELEYSCKNLS